MSGFMNRRGGYFYRKTGIGRKTPKNGVFYPPGPEKGGRGGKKGSKTPKSANPDELPGPEKSGFFQYDLVSFYRKMGFFGVFDKFEGSIFWGGGPKTGFLRVLTGFRGFQGKSMFLRKTVGLVPQTAKTCNACTKWVFVQAEKAVFRKEWVAIATTKPHKASPVDPKEGPRWFESNTQWCF